MTPPAAVRLDRRHISRPSLEMAKRGPGRDCGSPRDLRPPSPSGGKDTVTDTPEPAEMQPVRCPADRGTGTDGRGDPICFSAEPCYRGRAGKARMPHGCRSGRGHGAHLRKPLRWAGGSTSSAWAMAMGLPHGAATLAILMHERKTVETSANSRAPRSRRWRSSPITSPRHAPKSKRSAAWPSVARHHRPAARDWNGSALAAAA